MTIHATISKAAQPFIEPVPQISENKKAKKEISWSFFFFFSLRSERVASPCLQMLHIHAHLGTGQLR